MQDGGVAVAFAAPVVLSHGTDSGQSGAKSRGLGRLNGWGHNIAATPRRVALGNPRSTFLKRGGTGRWVWPHDPTRW